MRETITDAELEVLRLKARGRYRIMLLCTGLAALLILYGVWRLMMEEDDSLFVKIGATLFGTVTLSCGALAFFYWLLFQKPYKAFNDIFKSRYVLSTITEMGLFGQLSYDPKAGFTHDDIRNAAVVACGDKRYFESEDLLTGCYQNVRFAFSDVTTKRMVRRGKRNELDTLFDGQVIRFDRFDHQKISNGHLQIFQKEFLSDLRGWTAEYKVETDSAAFNSKFQIYAADEHNAFYILTPHLMEKIQKFQELVGEQIAVTFRGEAMFVAISRTRSIFDGVVDVPVAEQKALILGDMELLKNAGDVFLSAMPPDAPPQSRTGREKTGRTW